MVDMKYWRPNGWKKYHERYKSLTSTEYIPESITYPRTMPDAYEAGADAMLEALLRKSEYTAFDIGKTFRIPTDVKGWLVFIPDE
jgi:hypothetical protein